MHGDEEAFDLLVERFGTSPTAAARRRSGVSLGYAGTYRSATTPRLKG
jgi:hypothetical protein